MKKKGSNFSSDLMKDGGLSAVSKIIAKLGVLYTALSNLICLLVVRYSEFADDV